VVEIAPGAVSGTGMSEKSDMHGEVGLDRVYSPAPVLLLQWASGGRGSVGADKGSSGLWRGCTDTTRMPLARPTFACGHWGPMRLAWP